jgi:ferredoxin-like protein FixX
MPLKIDLTLLPHIATALEGPSDADAGAEAESDPIPPGTFCIPHGDRSSTRRLDELARLYGNCRVADLFRRDNDRVHVAYAQDDKHGMGASNTHFAVCPAGYARATPAARLAAANRVPAGCLIACAKGIMRDTDIVTRGKVRVARIPVPVTVYTPIARGDKRRRDADDDAEADDVVASKRVRYEHAALVEV